MVQGVAMPRIHIQSEDEIRSAFFAKFEVIEARGCEKDIEKYCRIILFI